MTTSYTPSPLVLEYAASDLYCLALKQESERGHHSKCYFGNVAKVEGCLDSDPFWHTPRAKFMPERGVVRFDYGGNRFEQKLTVAEIRWLDRFDAGQDVRSKRIVLDPTGPNTKLLYPVGSRNGRLPGRQAAARPPASPATGRTGSTAAPAPRATASSSASSPAGGGNGGGGNRAPVTTPPATKNFGGPDRKGHTTVGCNTNMAPNSGRAHRMRALNNRRVESEAKRQAAGAA